MSGIRDIRGVILRYNSLLAYEAIGQGDSLYLRFDSASGSIPHCTSNIISIGYLTIRRAKRSKNNIKWLRMASYYYSSWWCLALWCPHQKRIVTNFPFLSATAAWKVWNLVLSCLDSLSLACLFLSCLGSWFVFVLTLSSESMTHKSWDCVFILYCYAPSPPTLPFLVSLSQPTCVLSHVTVKNVAQCAKNH